VQVLGGLVSVAIIVVVLIALIMFRSRTKRRVAMQLTPYTLIDERNPLGVAVSVLMFIGRSGEWRPLGRYPTAQEGLAAVATYWGKLHRRGNLFRLITGSEVETRAFGKRGVDY
jgi:hypothetical protein